MSSRHHRSEVIPRDYVIAGWPASVQGIRGDLSRSNCGERLLRRVRPPELGHVPCASLVSLRSSYELFCDYTRRSGIGCQSNGRKLAACATSRGSETGEAVSTRFHLGRTRIQVIRVRPKGRRDSPSTPSVGRDDIYRPA